MSYTYTYNDILNNIKELGVKNNDILLVHSSMKSIGEVESGADTVLDALMAAVSDGMLILPTHTWKTMGDVTNIYDPNKEAPCVGILPQLFLKRAGVIRTLHPTHSLAIWSKNEALAKEFASGEENQTTPCSRNGCYGKLYDLNAKILLLGVGLNRNTYMHGVEEWFPIPERLTSNSLNLQIRMPDGALKPVTMKKHYKPGGISISEYYAKLEQPLTDINIITHGSIGDAECMLMPARETADYMTECLNKERDMFTYI